MQKDRNLKNREERSTSAQKSSTAWGLIFLGCFLLLLGLLRLSQFNATGEVQHYRFGFTEKGPEALIPIVAATGAGIISVIGGVFLLLRRPK